MTMNIGIMLLPMALAAAMVQSINAEIQYENPMIVRRYIPAFITAASLVNRDKNALPKIPVTLPGSDRWRRNMPG